MKIFAHRGASGEYPENTLVAFEQAIQQCCDGIELDIQYHHSNEFILLHDNYVKNSASNDIHYDQLPLHELVNDNVEDDCLGDPCSAKAKQNKNIPTLSQALQLIAGRCIVNIEIKSSTCDKHTIISILDLLEEQLDNAVSKYNFSYTQFIISSFNHPILLAIKTRMPQLLTAALIASCPLSYAKIAEEINAQSVHPSINCLNKALVNDAHQRGLKVYVYTVDKKADLQRCIQLAVDGIFTNFPAKSRAMLSKI